MSFRTALSFLLLCIPLQFVWTEEWTQHRVLDGRGRYHLYWKPPAENEGNGEIVFKVEVRTKGYVGFGLSPNGGMAGSDIVTGWVKDGQPYFQDRHGIGNTLPKKDQKQNWILTEAKENETHTTLKFRRKLNTCDDEDRVIDDSTVRVMYAFSDTDPTGDHPAYHFSDRGAKSVRLLHTTPKSHTDLEDPSLLHWDVRAPKVDVSAHESLYWCKIFKTPNVSKKHHVVGVKPLIQEGSEDVIHHALLIECEGATPEEFEGYVDHRGYDCNHPNVSDVRNKCDATKFSWTVGIEVNLVYKDQVGIPLESGTYYMLEMHYDNSQRTQGVIDESGFMIYYTPKVREYDAGVLRIGAEFIPRMFIPPGQEKFVVTGHSNPECFDPVISAEGIKIIEINVHAHVLGRRIIVRHFRGNQELPPLVVEKNYDFNYQETRYPKNEITILPGDQITVECTYDSSDRTTVTFGGNTTLEEMCCIFVFYYPQIDLAGAFSSPTFSTINTLLDTNFTDEMSLYSLSQYNWTNVGIRDLESVLMYSEHSSGCRLGNGQVTATKSLISYPSMLEPYVPEDTTCGEDTRD